MSTPMRRIRSPCCARDTSGHAARAATNEMKFRRLMYPSSRGAKRSTPSGELIVHHSKNCSSKWQKWVQTVWKRADLVK